MIKIITIKRYNFILGGLIIQKQQSQVRNGIDHAFRIVLPQHIVEGADPRSIGRTWFKSGKSMGGDPGK